MAEEEKPLRTWLCDCGETIETWRGEGGRDKTCSCGQSFNAFGQRLRDDWRDNPAWQYDDIDDATGYEIQHAHDW